MKEIVTLEGFVIARMVPIGSARSPKWARYTFKLFLGTFEKKRRACIYHYRRVNNFIPWRTLHKEQRVMCIPAVVQMSLVKGGGDDSSEEA